MDAWPGGGDEDQRALVSACRQLVSVQGQGAGSPPPGRTLFSEAPLSQPGKKQKRVAHAADADCEPQRLPQHVSRDHLGLAEPGHPFGLVCEAGAHYPRGPFTAAFGQGVVVRFLGGDGSEQYGMGILVGVNRGQPKGCAYLPCYRQGDFEAGGEDKAPSGWGRLPGGAGQQKVTWGDRHNVPVSEVWAHPDRRLACPDGALPEQVLISNKAYWVNSTDIVGKRNIMPADTWEPSMEGGAPPLYYWRCLDEGRKRVVDLAPSAKELILERSGASLLGVGYVLPQIMAVCVRVPLQDFFRELNHPTGEIDAVALSARAALGVLLRVPFPVLASVLCAPMALYERLTRRWSMTCTSPPDLEGLLRMDAGDLGINIGINHERISAALLRAGGAGGHWELSYSHRQPGLARLQWSLPLGP